MGLSNRQEKIAALSENELVEAIQSGAGDETAAAAAGELFGRYHRRVYAFCLSCLESHEKALDASQDTLLAAYEKIDSFAGHSKFSSWIFAIARNRCLNLIRSEGCRREEDQELEGLRDDSILQDMELVEKEDEERILALIVDNLEPVEQKALWLRCFEKVPVDEITRMLKIDTVSGARALLQKARRKLRAAMDGR